MNNQQNAKINSPDLIHGTDRLVFGASIRGKGHIKNGTPNQDAFKILFDKSSLVYAVVVADGAGSAKDAQHGSSACVEFLAEKLLEIGSNLVANELSRDLVKEKIELAIMQHREKLDPSGKKLRDYHHTLSAVLVSPTGGVLIQVGDSPIIVTLREEGFEQKNTQDVSLLFKKHSVYDEEKGEYANETHFVTQHDWRENLTIEFLPKGFESIFLMSDGAASAYISRGTIYAPIMEKTLSEILVSPESANEVVASYLTHEDLDGITSDDKTFVGIIPSLWLNPDQASLLVEQQEEAVKTAVPEFDSTDVATSTALNNELNTENFLSKIKRQVYEARLVLIVAIVLGYFFGTLSGRPDSTVPKMNIGKIDTAQMEQALKESTDTKPANIEDKSMNKTGAKGKKLEASSGSIEESKKQTSNSLKENSNEVLAQVDEESSNKKPANIEGKGTNKTGTKEKKLEASSVPTEESEKQTSNSLKENSNAALAQVDAESLNKKPASIKAQSTNKPVSP